MIIHVLKDKYLKLNHTNIRVVSPSRERDKNIEGVLTASVVFNSHKE